MAPTPPSSLQEAISLTSSLLRRARLTERRYAHALARDHAARQAYTAHPTDAGLRACDHAAQVTIQAGLQHQQALRPALAQYHATLSDLRACLAHPAAGDDAATQLWRALAQDAQQPAEPRAEFTPPRRTP
jgi:hypothetical protein